MNIRGADEFCWQRDFGAVYGARCVADVAAAWACGFFTSMCASTLGEAADKRHVAVRERKDLRLFEKVF